MSRDCDTVLSIRRTSMGKRKPIGLLRTVEKDATAMGILFGLRDNWIMDFHAFRGNLEVQKDIDMHIICKNYTRYSEYSAYNIQWMK